MARSNADLAVLSIFLIKTITSPYCSVTLFSTDSIRSSGQGNLFYISFVVNFQNNPWLVTAVVC